MRFAAPLAPVQWLAGPVGSGPGTHEGSIYYILLKSTQEPIALNGGNLEEPMREPIAPNWWNLEEPTRNPPQSDRILEEPTINYLCIRCRCEDPPP